MPSVATAMTTTVSMNSCFRPTRSATRAMRIPATGRISSPVE